MFARGAFSFPTAAISGPRRHGFGDPAQMSAMSRSHVTVTMVSFRKAGLVQYSRDEPLVIRLSALRQYLKRP